MFEDDDIQQQQEAKARLAQRRRQDDIRWLMNDQRGRRIVWRQLVDTRFETTTSLFDTHGGRQSYLLGAFEVGRGWSQEIRNLCPEQYALMATENTQIPDEVTQ